MLKLLVYSQNTGPFVSSVMQTKPFSDHFTIICCLGFAMKTNADGLMNKINILSIWSIWVYQESRFESFSWNFYICFIYIYFYRIIYSWETNSNIDSVHFKCSYDTKYTAATCRTHIAKALYVMASICSLSHEYEKENFCSFCFGIVLNKSM